jgi:hypothetical protein
MHAPAAPCCPAAPSMGRVTSRRWRVDLILGSAPGNKTMAASRPNSACTTGTAMALGPHERGHELGHSAPGVLLRQVRRTQGSVPVRVEYEPRPEFGLIHPRLVASADAVTAHGGSGVLVLSTQAALTVEGAGASALVTLHKGQESCFAPRQCDAWAPVPRPWTARRIRRAPADHVRHRRRAGPVGTAAAAPVWLARQRPGAVRQRRVGATATRRVRRVAGRGLYLARSARPPARGDAGVPGRRGRRGGETLARRGSGNLGIPWTAPAVPAQQAATSA